MELCIPAELFCLLLLQAASLAMLATYKEPCDESGCHVMTDSLQKNVELGDLCTTDVICKESIENSACLAGTCHCQHHFKTNDNGTKCTPRLIGDGCTSSSQCNVSNSLCANGYCACENGYRPSLTMTACRPILIDDFCEHDLDCSTVNNSFCTPQDVCNCKKGYIRDATFTYCRQRVLNDICMTSSDCYTSVRHSVCTDGKCECKHGFHPGDSLSVCVLKRVGDWCQNDMDCLQAVDSTHCILNSCSCLTGYMAVSERSKCIKRNLTSPCATDTDCSTFVTNSSCRDYTCQCISGLKQVKNANICERRFISDVCKTDSDCYDSVSHSKCVSGMCSCQLGYRYVNDMTCIRRNVGDACAANEDCREAVGNSNCTNATCVCNQGFKVSVDAATCDSNKINDDCHVNDDCSIAINDSFCDYDYRCKCKRGFQKTDAFNGCIRRKIYDNTCVFHEDCAAVIDNSRCHKYQCLCNAGFYPSSDNQTCVKFKIGDSGCKSDRRDCRLSISRSHCVDGACKCDVGYLAAENGTVCNKRTIGDPCEYSADCTQAVYDSDCINGFCTCLNELEPTPDLISCVPKPTQLMQDSCFFDGQCERISNNSYCKKLFDVSYLRSCVCKQGYIFRNDRFNDGECYVPEKIGDFCKSLDWCKRKLRDNVVCNNNTCGCRLGHLANRKRNGCLPYPRRVGDFCWADSDCHNIDHTLCDGDLSCRCHYMYQPGPTNTTCVPSSVLMKPEVPDVAVGSVCELHDYRSCSANENAFKYTRCGYVIGDAQSRCHCVPGYASRYDSDELDCVDADTYMFLVNITSELGCDTTQVEELHPLCYKYQPIKSREDYTNPENEHYLYFKQRLALNGMTEVFETTSPDIQPRYLISDVINVTVTSDGHLTVAFLVYIASEKYIIIEPTTLQYHILQYLLGHDGELGTSQMKVAQPYSENVGYQDFDECTEHNGTFNDCSPLAWCLNTRVSYMCSCKYINVIDTSPDTEHRPGRVCSVPVEETTHSLSCSNTNCETQWEYIGLGLIALVGLLFTFIGYEIYARKKELEKTDVYYAFHRASKKARSKAQELRRKTLRLSERDSHQCHKNPRVTFDVDAPEHVI